MASSYIIYIEETINIQETINSFLNMHPMYKITFREKFRSGAVEYYSEWGEEYTHLWYGKSDDYYQPAGGKKEEAFFYKCTISVHIYYHRSENIALFINKWFCHLLETTDYNLLIEHSNGGGLAWRVNGKLTLNKQETPYSFWESYDTLKEIKMPYEFVDRSF